MKSTRGTNLRFCWSVMSRVFQQDAALGHVDRVGCVELLREQDRRHRRAAAGHPVGPGILDHARDEADLVLAFVEVRCFFAHGMLLFYHKGTKAQRFPAIVKPQQSKVGEEYNDEAESGWAHFKSAKGRPSEFSCYD